jgi:hypothetical protein
LTEKVEVPEGCAKGERGKLANERSEAVSVGIPWMNPRERARVKVEMEGEPKARCK